MIPAAQRSPLTCRPALGSHQAQAEEKGPPAIHALCPVSSKNQLPTWKSACRHHHGTLTKGVWLIPQLGRATSYGTLGSPALKKLRLREQGVPLCMRLPEARSQLLRDPRAFGNACPLQLCETIPCLPHGLSGGPLQGSDLTQENVGGCLSSTLSYPVIHPPCDFGQESVPLCLHFPGF